MWNFFEFLLELFEAAFLDDTAHEKGDEKFTK